MAAGSAILVYFVNRSIYPGITNNEEKSLLLLKEEYPEANAKGGGG
jgi:hypothetical protein